jgi:hypothetical protein
MFSRTVRSRHQPDAEPLMERIVAWHQGQISEGQLVEWLHQRDREMALEVDSSTLNFEILEILLREFPHARFLLTIRDCYSWCNSTINQTLRIQETMHPLWRQLGRYNGAIFPHAPEEELLKRNNLMSLPTYFSRWARHNHYVLDKVPAERLLVVRTDQIKQRAFEIAAFAGLPRRSVRLDRTHEYRGPEKKDFLRQIDPRFVEAMAAKHCGTLMTRFFPEIKSLDDARL